MVLIAIVVGVLLISGIASLLTNRYFYTTSFYIGAFGGFVACTVGTVISFYWLISGKTYFAQEFWSLPLGTLCVGMDSLSCFFLFCICFISSLTSLYSFGYLKKSTQPKAANSALFFFNLLVISMIGIVLAKDAVLFLVSWELMTLTSFFLVSHNHEKLETRRASSIYLIASQVSVIFIFILFALLARKTGTYRFDHFESIPHIQPWFPTLLFCLALIGFGTKAGLWTLHIWLPEAHPAAPSHISALMSGIMIKLGIYGLLRILLFLGPPQTWWGIVLVTIGIISGISGVIQALGQHDIKRLLAYHSIENIGIIILGIGVGVLGQSVQNNTVAFLGFAGAILHVLNHGIFKGLLFKGAGIILRTTNTRNCEMLGGLIKKMPITGTTFLIGSLAISGLPPLNGFVSEWLIYVGLFYGALHFHGMATGVSVMGIVGLTFIGGLASLCFVKVFSVVFLGSLRSNIPNKIQDPDWTMTVPMLISATLCVVIGFWPEGAIRMIVDPVKTMGPKYHILPDIIQSLRGITHVTALLLGFIVLLTLLRKWLLLNRKIVTANTWGCGYQSLGPRMQYTATSFTQPLFQSLGAIIKQTCRIINPQGYFPTTGHFSEHLTDRSLELFWIPSISRIILIFRKLKILQQGKLQFYLLYILITLILLILWKIT